MHSLYLSILRKIADWICHAIAAKPTNLCRLLHSVHNSVSALVKAYSHSSCLFRCRYQHNCHCLYNRTLRLPFILLPKAREIKLHENFTYGPHAACGYHVKLHTPSRIYGTTYDRYNNNIWKITIEHTSVGLAHARPNYFRSSRVKKDKVLIDLVILWQVQWHRYCSLWAVKRSVPFHSGQVCRYKWSYGGGYCLSYTKSLT